LKGLQERLETAALSFAEQRSPGTGTLVRRALQVVITSQISRMAAALSYRTVFGLIPVLAIGVAFLGGFATDEQVENVIVQVLDFTGLADIVVEPEAVDTEPGGVGVAGPASPDELTRAAKLDEWLRLLVAKVRGVSFVAIGLTGLLMLIYAAVSFMVEIERAANTIYHAPTGRSWVRRVTQYWTTLTLGSIFLVGTFYIGGRFTSTVQSLTEPDQAQKEPADTTPRDDVGAIDSRAAEVLTKADTGAPDPAPPAAEEARQREGKETNFIVAAAGVAVSLVIGFLLLLFLYMTIPNARVSVQCAAIGAAFAAIMWEAGKQGFTLFVVHSAAQKLYGAIALIPLFLLWVYITWIIVLFGLQISYVLQNFRAFSMPEDEERGPVLVEPLTLLRVASIIAQRFGAGRTAELAEIAKAVGADERTTHAMLEALIQAALIHRVPVGQEREEFTLARPASEIRARELLELTHRMASGSAPHEEPARVAALRQAQLEAAADITLADLVERCEAAETSPETQTRTESGPGRVGWMAGARREA